ncbi:nickel pincer cofactor biosynthesis protein LarB [Streptomyces sp. NBC_01622]|uniref:nickel pincer cofactor biosynthesis protein LarB n=1 Tax=Streptomyces sp. NBC_01622 TaxID=2975903 RepID=UPI0038651B5C|nr:nickel pincer cofactor biosynthesis protein LarB [Streptomyces sp. NBC_01622]
MSGVLDLGFARLDLAREARQGLPEVVYGPGKTVEQISGIVTGLLEHNTGPVLVTRIEAETAEAVMARLDPGVHDEETRRPGPYGGQRHGPRTYDGQPHDGPGTYNGQPHGPATYDAEARLLYWRPSPAGDFCVTVVAAGTSDRPVAAEATAVAAAVGLDTTAIHDVGVAGLDRILQVRDRLQAADALIVVAGMEGALASVVGGLVRAPVVAVPVSTGYGASLEGVTALLAMHASCAAGVTVVNIDSGFSAAMAIHRIAQSLANTQRRVNTPGGAR